MASGYRELLSKLEEMAAYDGFLATLVDIRDSMVFYDRDLMLAGYTGAIEGLIISALAAACLEGDGAAEEAFTVVRKVVDEFPHRLTGDPSAPVDVQAVVDAFLRVGGWMLRERVSAYILAFSRYIHGDYDLEAFVDGLVAAAHALAERDPGGALDRVGEVGALMLRGQMLRARWLDVATGRLQLWLAGLRHMVGQLASTYPGFPWGPIDEERRRRPSSVVVDMEAFRKRRLMARDAWQLPAQGPTADPVDALIERVFSGPAALDRETQAALERSAEQVVPLLSAMVSARHLLEGPGAEPAAVVAAIRALALLRRHEVATRLVELATDPAAPREVAQEAREALERLGGLAVDGVSEYLRQNTAPQGGAALAGLLVRMPRSEKTFRALIELFQRLRWEDDGKLAVAVALAEYGDGRAMAVLQQALRDPQLPAGRVRREIEGAVRRLSRQKRSPRRPRVANKG
ncbi:MAG: hypothetical protein AB1609_03795 [Bacillota bacterium]